MNAIELPYSSVELPRNIPGVKFLRFMFTQRIWGFSIQETPHFDSQRSTDYFSEKLRNCRYYLEFGSGGSTCLAAKLGKPFTVVESDPVFLKAVRNKIKIKGLLNQSNQNFIHANIGMTESWGKPVIIFTPSINRLDAFRKYSDFPVRPSGPDGLPDLILVDGRFRVACALKAFRALRNQENWTLIVDDYANRPNYHVLEKFAKLERRVGRMAVFDEVIPGQEDKLAATIERYVHDSR